jgi:hypothetical protein
MASRRKLIVGLENGKKTSKIINDINACSLFYAKMQRRASAIQETITFRI